MKYQAVIFDLFGTLVENYTIELHEGSLRGMASVLSAPSEAFVRLWYDTFNERCTGVFKSPEENNTIRIGSDYHQIANTIKSLIRIKGERDNDNPTIFISNAQFVNPERAVPTDQPTTPKFILDDFSSIYEGQVAFKNTWAIFWPGLENVKEGDVTKVVREVSPILSGENYCSHPVETVTIRWNGDVVACCYDLTSKYVLGNIRESNLVTIWNNEKYKRIRRTIHNRRYLPLCYHCHVIRPHQFLNELSATGCDVKPERIKGVFGNGEY